jgi:hypothetical protein
VPLTGVQVSGDIDYANQAAHVIGTVPGVQGYAGEILVVGGSAYIRTPGQDKYTQDDPNNIYMNPGNTSNGPAGIFKTILGIVAESSVSAAMSATPPVATASPSTAASASASASGSATPTPEITASPTLPAYQLDPKLIGVDNTAGGPSYHIQVLIPPYFVANQLGLAGDHPGMTTIDLWVFQSSFLIQRVEMRTTELNGQNGAFRLVLSEYNNITPIVAPLPGQIASPSVQPSAS